MFSSPRTSDLELVEPWFWETNGRLAKGPMAQKVLDVPLHSSSKPAGTATSIKHRHRRVTILAGFGTGLGNFRRSSANHGSSRTPPVLCEDGGPVPPRAGHVPAGAGLPGHIFFASFLSMRLRRVPRSKHGFTWGSQGWSST